MREFLSSKAFPSSPQVLFVNVRRSCSFPPFSSSIYFFDGFEAGDGLDLIFK